MIETKTLLPLGSVVLLEEGLQKLVIVGRGAIYKDPKTGEEKSANYIGVLYPTGLNPETAIFFDHKNIVKVIFEGYVDEKEERFLEIYSARKKDLEHKEKKDKIINDLVF